MKLYNSLTKKIESVNPFIDDTFRIYSCGPTVYDHAHIGNLSAFIVADTLKRAIEQNGFKTLHAMNFTDVDDKTINRSREEFPNLNSKEALKKLTKLYEQKFLIDISKVGIDVDRIKFIRATDSIPEMISLIKILLKKNIAYIAEDGIYFSINEYKKRGKIYGQLVDLSNESKKLQRISNDEYDKLAPLDFALWKFVKNNEPFWSLNIDGKDLAGRPGWHIECSAMSESSLGIPFDIHTGGIDLKFPHHENEIAQSTAVSTNSTFAKTFLHSEHLLVDGKKMSKSLNNFITLKQITERGYNPLVFRFFVLQSHYRTQSNFSWQNLDSAQNRLLHWQAITDRKWQLKSLSGIDDRDISDQINNYLSDDLNTPEALAVIDEYFNEIESSNKAPNPEIIDIINNAFGLNLGNCDISNDDSLLISSRESARICKNYDESDKIRLQLKNNGLEIEDTPSGPIWKRNFIS